MPPLATCGIFLARGDFSLAAGALLLAVTNIIAIQFAASVVFYLSGFHGLVKGKTRSRGVLVGVAVSVAVLLAFSVVLTANLHRLIAAKIYHSAVRKVLKAQLVRCPGAYLADVRFSRTDTTTIVSALV